MYRPLLEKLHIGPLNGWKFGSKVSRRTGKNKSRTTRESRRVAHTTDIERSIGLKSMTRNGGFEQLFDDNTDDPSVHSGPGFSQTSITSKAKASLPR